MNKSKDTLNSRCFAGNNNVLCDIGNDGCPFVRIYRHIKGYCLLYKVSLNYYDTGNNQICHRCNECKGEQ